MLDYFAGLTLKGLNIVEIKLKVLRIRFLNEDALLKNQWEECRENF